MKAKFILISWVLMINCFAFGRVATFQDTVQQQCLFVAKISPTGELLWFTKAQANGNTIGTDVTFFDNEIIV